MNNKVEYQIDQKTYLEIQKLKEFVRFVAGLSSCNEKKAQEIIFLITTIDQYSTHKQWSVEFNIEDFSIDEDNEGVFLRSWQVFFEDNQLLIEARTIHTDIINDDWKEHFGNDLYYSSTIFFAKVKGKQVYLDQDINIFVEDAKNYKKYMTPTMNHINIEFDIS